MTKNAVAKTGARKFVFKKHATIGAADAIDDEKFLAQSFLDNGEISILSDTRNPRSIVVGRTGSGKTALLKRIAETDEIVLSIPPEGLALTYVSNNEVLNFFRDAGVKLDLFYKLLWRHVFTVEIIRERYHIENDRSRDSFIQQIKDRLSGSNSRRQAVDYILQWGESFWLESEYRVKEVTKKLEQDLKSSIGASLAGSIPGTSGSKLDAHMDSNKKMTEEERAEVVRRGQSVVDKVQMKVLSDIIDLLEKEILDDKQKKYYITVDRLDENWVNDDLRYQLIKALLDTVREFNTKMQNVKIIVAIREDLLDRVFRYTREPGYQEEKYKSMCLPLTWKEIDLSELLDKRVNQLVREQYTTASVGIQDLLPPTIKKGNPTEYLLERTMLRPRDAIMFFNECIACAEGEARLSQAIIYRAEGNYSEARLRALADEWSSDYSNLIELAMFIKKFSCQFKKDLIEAQIEDLILEFLCSEPKEDVIVELMRNSFNNGDIDAFVNEMLKILFRVGIIGVKQETFSGFQWSYLGHKLLTSEINENAIFKIHPAFWRVLGTQAT